MREDKRGEEMLRIRGGFYQLNLFTFSSLLSTATTDSLSDIYSLHTRPNPSPPLLPSHRFSSLSSLPLLTPSRTIQKSLPHILHPILSAPSQPNQHTLPLLSLPSLTFPPLLTTPPKKVSPPLSRSHLLAPPKKHRNSAPMFLPQNPVSQ